MKVTSPRKGSELLPRVFASWQEQVNRAIRNLGFVRAISREATVDLPSIAAHGEFLQSFTVNGARLGAAVLVNWGNTGQPTGVMLTGQVVTVDVVRVRANNYTDAAQDPANKPISIVAFNL